MVTKDILTIGNLTAQESRAVARRVEDEVHLLLGRLVHHYARLDLNMGLQLKWLGPYRGVEVTSKAIRGLKEDK